ncbi:MAG: shikimate dehydrogenase [Ignavibacteria bacterium]|nr:shikimate dehydrogenase [Ignavibacteria bacterium]
MQDKFHTNTNILGILGHPIKHSYSPFMHNLAAELLNLDYIYLPFDVPQDSLKDALKGIIALGITGFNVTLPFKEGIISYLHSVSEEAAIIGSVNTVVNELGKLTGYNTDTTGIYETLAPYKDDFSGLEVSIIGAGGAARALVYTLIRHFKPSRINIINRTEQKAESLKIYFTDKMKYEYIHTYELFPHEIIPVLNSSKLIINATSVGMLPDTDDSPINTPKIFMKNQIVFDTVYNPADTRFLQLARGEGAITLNGIKMLVHQGARAFELWTGQQMPIEAIYDAVRKHLEP